MTKGGDENEKVTLLDLRDFFDFIFFHSSRIRGAV